MRIEQVELRHVRLPLVHPFQTSFGEEAERDPIIVTMRAEGLVGHGESATMAGPWYLYETTETCWHILRDFLVPIILGQDVPDAGGLQDRMAPVRGHHLAKTGLEQAFWDLLAKREGVPLARVLGGHRDAIESGVSVGIQPSVEALLERIADYVSDGYRRIKIKIKPGWDVSVVRSVREQFPETPLMVDANAAYTLQDLETFKTLDGFGLMMVEQPLSYEDLLDHARLQSQIETPICLDESVGTFQQVRLALELDSCRIVNIKPGRVGGPLQAIKIHDLCQSAGVPVWCGGLLETGVGRAHNVAMATLPNFSLPGDISASDRYFSEDIVNPPFRLNPDGTITVPTGTGIGVEVDEDRLESLTARKETFAA